MVNMEDSAMKGGGSISNSKSFASRTAWLRALGTEAYFGEKFVASGKSLATVLYRN
jgi:hypothetical protein